MLTDKPGQPAGLPGMILKGRNAQITAGGDNRCLSA